MIRIIRYSVNCDDDGNITSIELKFKHIQDEDDCKEYPLLTTITMAFCKISPIEITGKALRLTTDPQRGNIVNMRISFKQSQLSDADISDFISRFKKAL